MKPFRAELERRYPGLWSSIEARHRAIAPDVAFAGGSSNPMDRRLEICAWFLAMMLTLESRGASFEEVREVSLAIAHRLVQPRNFLHRWLKRLPGLVMGTPLIAPVAWTMQAKTGRKGHADGFLVQVITDPLETNGLRYGFDILECGICKLFAKHGAARYASILCEVDEVTSALAGLVLVRRGTIARGASRCDFRFRR